MSDFVTSPYTNAELMEIRSKLEVGEYRAEKFAVIQRLIESHLLVNKIADKNHDHGLKFAEALDEVIDVLDHAGMVKRTKVSHD